MDVRNADMRLMKQCNPAMAALVLKQYNANKPAKYGLLYRSLCDANIPYTYFSLPYAGKPEILEGDAVKYYITGTDEYSKYLVNGLSALCKIQRINISMNQYLTSVSLASWALEKNITGTNVVGTMQHDHKGMPKELKSVANREAKSVMCVYHSKENANFLY